MENMIKQTRVKFSGLDEEIQEGETSNVREQKPPSQKTRSFKGDSRRVQNWYRGQSSRELTYDYDSDYMESDEFRTAVAAAAFAINSVGERRTTRGRTRDDSLSKPKRKQEDGVVSMTRKIIERLPSTSSTSNKMKIKEDDIVPISIPSLLSKKFSELQEKLPQRANSPAKIELKPEGGMVSSSNDTKRTNQLTFLETSKGDERGSILRPNDIKAEVYEKTEMERIKERHEKLNAKILEWENEKKAKAKKKLTSNKDGQPEKKRARALENYKSQMDLIDQIAGEARSQAEENRKKEVMKLKKKTEMIRSTGKIPTKTCLCF